MADTAAGRGLAIVRCGRNSLHSTWRDGPAAAEWDLQLSPYEAGDPDWPKVRPGQKWDGLHAHLLADPSWKDYDYIWLPDDDFAFSAETAARFFEACRRYDAKLAAPALSEDSYYSRVITMRNRSFAAREVTYVEVMAPCFRRDVLEQMLPTFTISLGGAGWGIDQIWCHILRRRSVYIFDDLPMLHTRPVGGQRDEATTRSLFRDAVRLLKIYEVRPLFRTLRGYDAEGGAQEADAGPFLLRYLQGYDYLIEQHPELLQRLIDSETKEPPKLHSPWHWITRPLDSAKARRLRKTARQASA